MEIVEGTLGNLRSRASAPWAAQRLMLVVHTSNPVIRLWHFRKYFKLRTETSHGKISETGFSSPFADNLSGVD